LIQELYVVEQKMTFFKKSLQYRKCKSCMNEPKNIETVTQTTELVLHDCYILIH